MKILGKCLMLALSTVFVSTGAFAQDEGLYEEPPPVDSTFIRVVGLDASANTEAAVGPVTVTAAPSSEIQDYFYTTAGSLPVSTVSGDAEMTFDVQKFYTLVVGADDVTQIPDPSDFNLAKVTLVFYNLSDAETLGLSTADGATPVFKDVAFAAPAVVAVNPLKIDFGAVLDGAVVATTEPVQLERGNVYSLIATGTASDLTLAIAKNSVSKQ